MQKPELLSPAGGREQLESAVCFGADAVYLGSELFNMRAAASLGPDALAGAVSFAHENGARAYLVCNTLPSCAEAQALPDFFRAARAAGADALIAADLGVMMLARRTVPEIPLHVSTQAGVVNHLTAAELYRLGASRVVLARELSLAEIRRIRDNTPPELELEAFVHGAMCMSVSGRCLLSSHLTGRDANRGACAQPCRWRYRLVEEKRPGQYFPIGEDERGSYILNANDLCMIEHVGALAEAGVSSFKIEGRAKSAYYTASVTAAYRAALDAWMQRREPPPWALEEVGKVSHRPYSTGFYFGAPGQNAAFGGSLCGWEVLAMAEGWSDGVLEVSLRNRFFRGEEAELLLPREGPRPLPITAVEDPEEGAVETACHPMRHYRIPCPFPVPPGAWLRKRTGGTGNHETTF